MDERMNGRLTTCADSEAGRFVLLVREPARQSNPFRHQVPRHTETCGEEAHLGALTSAPWSMRNLTTTSLPPAHAACNGRTPLRTELMGCPLLSAYSTRPRLPDAAAKCRSYLGTAGMYVSFG